MPTFHIGERSLRILKHVLDKEMEDVQIAVAEEGGVDSLYAQTAEEYLKDLEQIRQALEE